MSEEVTDIRSDAGRLRRAATAGYGSWDEAIRGTADLSQERAGALLGVSHATIHNWRTQLGVLSKSPTLSAAAKQKTFLENLQDPRHGTPNGYRNYKCRCDECRSSWTDYLRERRHAKKASQG